MNSLPGDYPLLDTRWQAQSTRLISSEPVISKWRSRHCKRPALVHIWCLHRPSHAEMLVADSVPAILIGWTSLWTNGRTLVSLEINRRRAMVVLGKIDEILSREQAKEHERDERFVELARFVPVSTGD